jgi:hypothetical protein
VCRLRPKSKIGILSAVAGESLIEPAKAGVSLAADSKYERPEKTRVLDPAQP